MFKDEKLDAFKFLRLLYRRRKTIIIALLTSLLLSIVVTYFIPPRYSSFGIIFPPSSNSLEDVINKPDFGFDLQADRLMQILESQIVRDSIIQAFALIEYYETDTSKRDWKFKLHEKFIRDVTFFRSKYMSIVISASTKSPELSANIVNRIIDMIDELRESIFYQNFMVELEIVESDYQDQKAFVRTFKDSIQQQLEGRDNEVLEFVFLNTNYLTEKDFGSVREKLSLSDELSLHEEQMLLIYLNEQNKLHSLKGKYEATKSKIEKPFSKVYIIDRAKPTHYRSFPSYKLNAAIAVGLTLAITILIFWLKEVFPNFREQIMD